MNEANMLLSFKFPNFSVFLILLKGHCGFSQLTNSEPIHQTVTRKSPEPSLENIQTIKRYFSRLLEHQWRLLSSSILHLRKSVWLLTVTLLSSNSTRPQIYRRRKTGMSSRISCPQVPNVFNILQSKWFRLKKKKIPLIWKRFKRKPCLICYKSLSVSQELKQMSFPFFFFFSKKRNKLKAGIHYTIIRVLLRPSRPHP